MVPSAEDGDTAPAPVHDPLPLHDSSPRLWIPTGVHRAFKRLDVDCHYKRSDRCTHRLGGRWNVAPAFSMSLEGDRRESTGEESPEHALNLRGSMRW